jgi:G3E family GTPase
MRIVTIGGMQGSGKTTLIRELIALFGAKGRRSALIVNEDGEETYTQNFLEAHGVEILKIRGG